MSIINPILCIFLAASLVLKGQGFIDPAPPKVQELLPMAIPKPLKQKGLIFYSAPKPLALDAITHNWQTFLGPTHNAISSETKLLKRFGASDPSIVWQVPKGEGYASVAVVDKRVILFHRIKNKEVIQCLHALNGQRFWEYAYATAYEDRYGYGNGPRCQPVSDGEYVYTFGAEAKLHCLKLTTGQILWQRDIYQEFKLKPSFFGVGSTPLIEGNLLIVNIGAPGGPCVAAFDKRTGKMVWGAGRKWGASYASPIPATIQGQRRVFVFAGGKSRPAHGGLLSIDPENGIIDCRFPWRARRYTSVNSSSPLVIGTHIYISECYGAGGVLLKILPQGGCQKVWSNRFLQTHFMTAVYKDGYIYGIDGHGPRNAPIVCIESKSGKQMWRKEPKWKARIKTRNGEQVYGLPPALASMLLVDGRCLLLGQYGHLVWLDLNPKGYRELDSTHLFLARETWSMPALSRGLLYVCQNDRGMDGTKPRLICYDLRAKESKTKERKK